MEEQTNKTKVIVGSEARKQLFEGLKLAAEAVECTLGPKGKTVLIQQKNGGAPINTKDGVTVSKSISLKDPIKRMGAELLKEAASMTNEVAGDGTTTASTLTRALVSEGLRLLEAGYSSSNLCNGLEFAHDLLQENLRKLSTPIDSKESIIQVATISANNDRAIGELVASAIEKAGCDGIVAVEDAKGMYTSLETVEGSSIERGYLSPYFVNNSEKMHAFYKDAKVLVTDKKLSSLRDIISVLESIAQSRTPLLIIADDIDGEALQGIVVNKVKLQLPVVAIKAPGYGNHKIELLNDICALTGAKLASSSTGVNIGPEVLGNAKSITVDAKNTLIVSSQSVKDNLFKRINELKLQLQDVTLSQDESVKLKQRLAKLSGGVCVIKVGGVTELEMIERKYRIEDALNATRAAIAEGILPGGGIALFRASMLLDGAINNKSIDEKAGCSMMLKSILAPLRRIIENAGKSPDVVISNLKTQPDSIGYNAANDKYEDLVKNGIIDPTKVTCAALKHATSVAMTFLQLDAVICEDL